MYLYSYRLHKTAIIAHKIIALAFTNYEKYVEKDDPEPATAAGTSDMWADVF